MATSSASNARPNTHPGWGTLALGVMLLAAIMIWLAPANWLAQVVESESGGRLLLADAHGSLWDGEAVLAFADIGVDGSMRDMLAAPGRIHWHLGLAGWNMLTLTLSNPLMLDAPLQLRVSPGHAETDAATLRLPLTLLRLAGAPFNSLRIEGNASLHWDKLRIEPQALVANGTLDIADLACSLSTLRPLGTYRMDWHSDASGAAWKLATLGGLLRLEGDGAMQHGRSNATLRARSDPAAKPADAQRLQTLLNALGPRVSGADDTVQIRLTN